MQYYALSNSDGTSLTAHSHVLNCQSRHHAHVPISDWVTTTAWFLKIKVSWKAEPALKFVNSLQSKTVNHDKIYSYLSGYHADTPITIKAEAIP